MPTGAWGLEFKSADEERLFTQSRRLSGFHTSLVKSYYPKDAYVGIMGHNWNQPEPKGRGRMGNWGMMLRYCTIDAWYAEEALGAGKLEQEEIDRFVASWGKTAFANLPLADQDLLDYWREHRKDKKEREETNRRKRQTRREQRFQEQFDAERQPDHIYRRLKTAIPNPNPVDEQLLRSLSRLLAQSNDMLWQAENMKNDGEVPLLDLQGYSKLVDISVKTEKQALDLLKQHGYDFQARRRRREAQTATEILDETIDEFAGYFDTNAIVIICPHCNQELGLFLRNYPTREYIFIVPECPGCGQSVREVLEPLPDEVMDD